MTNTAVPGLACREEVLGAGREQCRGSWHPWATRVRVLPWGMLDGWGQGRCTSAGEGWGWRKQQRWDSPAVLGSCLVRGSACPSVHLKDKPAKRYRGNSELQPLEPRYKFDVACRTHAMQTSPLLHSPYSLLEKTFFFFFFFLVHLLIEKLKAAEGAELMRSRVWPWVSWWGKVSSEWT